MASIVLSSLPFSNQSGDQLVSKVVTGAITALFKRTGKLEAVVRAEPVTKLLQGSLDSFDLIGHDLLMYNGLRIKAMEMYLQAVSIDFGAIFQGQVKLKQPTTANMRVVLSEEDLTASFNTPFILEKLEKLQYKGENLKLQNIQMIFTPEERCLNILGDAILGENPIPLSIDITAQLETYQRQKIQFTNVVYQGEPEVIELSTTLIEYINNLLDLEKFSLDGISLKVDRLRLQNKQIIFYGMAHIERFPKGRKS